MSRYVSRREFLAGSALVASGVYATSASLGAPSRSPNDKLNIGIIGVHSRGASNTKSVSTENIVALCDVDEKYLAEAAQKYPQAKTYIDWRQLI